jgi:hypothetical protein
MGVARNEVSVKEWCPMKKVISFGLLAIVIAFAAVYADDQPKKVGALPPHPLDLVFERANSVKAVNEGLLNNDLFKKAVIEALKAKREQEQRFRDNPRLMAASPAQAARQKFLEVITGATPTP